MISTLTLTTRFCSLTFHCAAVRQVETIMDKTFEHVFTSHYVLITLVCGEHLPVSKAL